MVLIGKIQPQQWPFEIAMRSINFGEVLRSLAVPLDAFFASKPMSYFSIILDGR
jgi:hypothetical protein